MPTQDEDDVVTEKSKRRDQQAPRVAGEIFTVLTIGQRIRCAREIKGWKQAELALEADLTQAAVSNLETDGTRKPSGPSLLRLASAIDVNPDWILQGVGNMSTTSAITKDEVDLLRSYRGLRRDARAEALDVIKKLCGPAAPKRQ